MLEFQWFDPLTTTLSPGEGAIPPAIKAPSCGNRRSAADTANYAAFTAVTAYIMGERFGVTNRLTFFPAVAQVTP